MKNIAILGSTGSIGQNALEVIRHFPGRFKVIALTANSNTQLLLQQIKEFKPSFVGAREDTVRSLQSRLGSKLKLFIGQDGLQELVGQKAIEHVLLGISGSAALAPLLKAIDSGKEISLANKEALVMAGSIIMDRAAKKKTKIMPIDSEQSAIWQCLLGQNKAELKNIYLTASGGPFRERSRKDLKGVSLKSVLRHPRWRMGRKITVDSATLINKGFELLEAMFLFNCPADKIKVLIHPQALIHSMVEFIDGVVLAQLSATDMRIPIQYALLYPERAWNCLPGIDFYKLKELHFEKPDFRRFPCLGLAYQAARQLGTAPCVLNAANEVCVDAFLKRRIDFLSIPKVIGKVLARHRNKLRPSLDDILGIDAWARREAYKVIAKSKKE